MTDQTIPNVTDDDRRLARKWAENIESDMDTWGDSIRAAVRVILDAVPAPPRPTLADMCDEERAACQWMQADVENRSVRYVIVNPYDAEGDAALAPADGGIEWFSPERVTPRPDLPLMEWTGSKKPAPSLPDGWRIADHDVYGRVVVTNPTPNRDGHVYFVHRAADRMGCDWHRCDPAKLTYIDKETDQ